MKIIVFAVVICLFLLNNVFAQENDKSIKVQISGLVSNEGQVIVEIYNNSNDYLKNPSLRKVAIIEKGKADVSFEGIQTGTYAIMCYHDENGNNKLDLNSKGRPMEKVGVSNNAKGFFGPPKFQAAKFLVKDEDIIQIIEL